MFWFADKLNDPLVLWHSKKAMDGVVNPDKLLPLMLIWGPGIDFNSIAQPQRKAFFCTR